MHVSLFIAYSPDPTANLVPTLNPKPEELNLY